MKTIEEKRLDFLNETVAHYNSNNRAQTLSYSCQYAPIGDRSLGCAIGRHLPIECQKFATEDVVHGRCQWQH